MSKFNTPQKSADELFAEAVREHLASGTWTASNSEAVIQKLMVDSDGKPVALDESDKRLISALVNPTIETQLALIQDLATRKGRPLEDDQLRNVRRVINPQTFRQQLKKAEFLPKSKDERPSLKALLQKAH